MINALIQSFFFISNICTGKYQAYRFDTLQKRINHKVWAVAYGIVAAQSFWFGHNLYLVAACVIQHLPVFNTALNFSRKVQLPFWKQLFYTHPEDPNGSWQDKVWGKLYPFVFFISIALLITIQFFIYE